MCAESFNFTGNEVSCDDTLCLTVDDYEVEHLVTWIALYGACCNLLVEGSICAEKELLTGLSPGIESTAYLHATERAVCKISAIFTCERNTLGNALVDDCCADLGETVDIRLPCTVVTSLDGVIEETVD